MEKKKCVNCDLEFESKSKTKKFCSVKCSCSYNNKRKENTSKKSEVKEKLRKKALEQYDKKYGALKKFDVNCKCCGAIVVVEEREKQFPKKDKYFCSKSCSNTRRHTSETKSKISNSLHGTGNKDVFITCKQCNVKFERKWKKRNQKFCSRSCASKFVSNTEERKSLQSLIGRRSAAKQSIERRSKNEIHFANLCKEEFRKVITNEPIFNGWDADVIVQDLNIAVLWNGKWHYEKITESHSVSQVQNRDKIKIKEIKKAGYIPYVIKDMGRANKEKVEKEFKKFIKFVNQIKLR